MDLQEVLVAASATALQIHDVLTGSNLVTFKLPQTAAIPAGPSAVPPCQTSSFISAKHGLPNVICHVSGSGKGAAHFFNLSREAPFQKSLLPFRLVTVAVSPNGEYLAGGEEKGRIALWRLSTGQLTKVFDAHYRPITCLAWTVDSRTLLSGSEDATICGWSLPSMIKLRPNMESPSPKFTLRDHSLALTDLATNLGSEDELRILSSSLDGTCKLWAIKEAAPESLTFSFPSASKALRVAFDPTERFFFAIVQRESTWTVVRTDLYKKLPVYDGLGQPIDTFWNQRSVNTVSDWPQEGVYHSKEELFALHLSAYSPHVFVSTATSVVILSSPSLQPLRTIQLPTNTTPLTYLHSIIRPPELVSAGLRQTAEQPEPRVKQLAHSEDTADSRRATLEPFQHARGSADDLLGYQPQLLASVNLATSHIDFSRAAPEQPSKPAPSHSADVISLDQPDNQLLEENAKLKQQLEKALSFNETLWKGVVEGTLKVETPEM